MEGKLIGMKILKRVTAVLLTAVVAVSFTACGGRSEHAKKLNIDTAVSINIWYQDDAYTSYLDYIAQRFIRQMIYYGQSGESRGK